MFNTLIARDSLTCFDCGRCQSVCRETTGSARPAVCVACGDCVRTCPSGSLTPQRETDRLCEALDDPERVVVLHTATPTRARLAGLFGQTPSAVFDARLVEAVRRLGARHFDDDTASALIVREEAAMLLELLRESRGAPLFSSSCPAWVNYLELYYPERLPHLSDLASSWRIGGMLAKAFSRERYGIAPERIFNVTVTGCLAALPDMLDAHANHAGRLTGRPELRDVDAIIAPEELTALLAARRIDFAATAAAPTPAFPAIDLDPSGSLLLAVARTAHAMLTGGSAPTDPPQWQPGYGGIYRADLRAGPYTLRFGLSLTLRNARCMLEDFEATRRTFDFIEFLSCPEGCGVFTLPQEWFFRAGGAQSCDRAENVDELYRTVFGAPLGPTARQLLHVRRKSRRGERRGEIFPH